MSWRPRDDNGELVPPPARICLDSWLTKRDLSYGEAEIYHLRQAAKCAASWFVRDTIAYEQHLQEAARNRAWRVWAVGGPPRSVLGGQGIAG